jgi:hypothetical protein
MGPHATPVPLAHEGFGAHPREEKPEQREGFGPHPQEEQPEQRQQPEQPDQRQREEGRGYQQKFAPHQRRGDERVVQGHPHHEQDHRDSNHHHFQHFGEHGYYQDGQWYPDDSYPAYQDTMPDDGVSPPVALEEGSPSSACYVNIPQDQVLDVRDVPSGDTVVSSLQNGTDVVIADKQEAWVLIKLIDPNNPDNLGWVPQDYIQCSSDDDRQE